MMRIDGMILGAIFCLICIGGVSGQARAAQLSDFDMFGEGCVKEDSGGGSGLQKAHFQTVVCRKNKVVGNVSLGLVSEVSYRWISADRYSNGEKWETISQDEAREQGYFLTEDGLVRLDANNVRLEREKIFYHTSWRKMDNAWSAYSALQGIRERTNKLTAARASVNADMAKNGLAEQQAALKRTKAAVDKISTSFAGY